jgi:hypothetical protein
MRAPTARPPARRRRPRIHPRACRNRLSVAKRRNPSVSVASTGATATVTIPISDPYPDRSLRDIGSDDNGICYRSMRRSRTAIATACVLLTAPSLWTAETAWALTVRLEILRILAISPADLPRAAHVRTSTSRGVSRRVSAENRDGDARGRDLSPDAALSSRGVNSIFQRGLSIKSNAAARRRRLCRPPCPLFPRAEPPLYPTPDSGDRKPALGADCYERYGIALFIEGGRPV